MALLEVEHLSHTYVQRKGLFRETTKSIALQDISFTLDEKKVVGIIGESGSGKTTIARAILRLIKPTEGTIFFIGQKISHLDQKAINPLRKNMQAVLQSPTESLNPRFTIEHILVDHLAFHGILGDPDKKKDVLFSLLDQVGLSGKVLGYYPHQLSLGQKQRICIARAMSTKPLLLILDEALSSLDLSIQAQILNLLIDLQEEYNTAYLFISHDLRVVAHIADEVLVMEKGVLVEKGVCKTVLSSPQHPYTEKLLQAAQTDFF